MKDPYKPVLASGSSAATEAMFKIGDFSQLGRVSVRTLHHYDELGLLKPARVDDGTEYRFYALEQLPRLHRIVVLKELGFSLKEISALLESASSDVIRAMLERKRAEVATRLEAERVRLGQLEARLRGLDEGAPPDYDVTLKTLPPRKIFSKRYFVPHLNQMDRYCEAFYTELYAVLDAQGLEPAEAEFTLYHTDGFTEENIDVEVAVVLATDDFRRFHLPDDETFSVRELAGVATAASLLYHGLYRELDRAAGALVLWMGASGYGSAGAAREVHLSGPVVETGKEKPVVVELQVPVTKHPLTLT